MDDVIDRWHKDDPFQRTAQQVASIMAAATERVLTLMTAAGLDMREVRIRDMQPAPEVGSLGPQSIARMPPESFDYRQILDSDREVAAELRWSVVDDGGTWVLRTQLRPDLQAFAREREHERTEKG